MSYEFPLGSPNWLQDNTILITEVGSRAHGTGVDGQDDSDHMGIVVEPEEYVLGLKKFEQFQWRSKPEGVRSEAGDLDFVVYGLKKYLSLALKGNPSVLVPLMVRGSNVYHFTQLGLNLRDADWWSSKLAGPRFLGYLQAQRDRLLGTRGGRHGGKGRPELEEAYGFDTKFAMHMCRLGLSGIEYMSTGRFSEPIKGIYGDLLRDIRQGRFSKEECIEMASDLEYTLKKAIDDSLLPDEPNWDLANQFMRDAYMQTWGVVSR